MEELFRKFSHLCSRYLGTSWAFIAALGVIVVWGLSGPLFGFSDTWQLVINTGTTIVTFLMVFLIQNTQNRDAKALQLKLDELIRGVHGARTGFVGLEELTDAQLEELEEEFQRIRKREDGDAGPSIAAVDEKHDARARTTGAASGSGSNGSSRSRRRN